MMLQFNKKKQKQNTFCHCPKCSNELISSGSFISDEDIVTYKCTECNEISMWNFDIAPVPILLELEL